MIGEQPWADRAQPDLRHGKGQRQRVDQGNVKHVEEEGHTSEKGNSAGETGLA